MIIRNEQMRGMAYIKPDEFKVYMLDHMRSHFPVHCSLHTDDSLFAVIDKWLVRAKAHGFTSRYEACLFIDIMFMLGQGIDTDPVMPRIAHILQTPGDTDPTKKINLLYKIAVNYLDNVIGDNEVFPLRPIRRIMNYPLSNLSRQTASGEDEISAFLQKLWPAKHRNAGVANMRSFMSLSRENAKGYGFSDKVSVRYFSALSFVFGHDVHTDPLYPWVSEVLNDRELTTESEKYNALHQVVHNKIGLALQKEPAFL